MRFSGVGAVMHGIGASNGRPEKGETHKIDVGTGQGERQLISVSIRMSCHAVERRETKFSVVLLIE